MTSVATPLPIVPLRRSHSQFDVIDVDLIPSVVERPQQRRRLDDDVVVDLTGDSDNEILVSAVSRSPRRNPRPGGSSRRNRRLTSLPPPPQNNDIPPVPRLPREHAPYRAYPMRARPPAMPDRNVPAVVRPNAQPFDFENNIRRDERPIDFTVRPVAVDRPPHYHPMALGGALMTAHQHNAFDNHLRHRNAPAHRPRSLIPTGGALRRINALGAGMYEFVMARLWGDDDDDHRRTLREENEWGLHFRQRPEPEDYKSSYTHPDPTPADFSRDFAQAAPTPVIEVDSPAGSSSAAAQAFDFNTIIVCAKCLDPLVISGSSTDEAEAKRQRVWGLRCGHMIDGKCYESMLPVDEPEIIPEKSRGKGKGKAVDNEPRSRYELRSRPSDSSRTHPPSPPKRKQPIARGKGKGKARDAVEDQKEWQCPVAGCGRPHVSVKIAGVWTPGKEDGPIAMFL